MECMLVQSYCYSKYSKLVGFEPNKQEYNKLITKQLMQKGRVQHFLVLKKQNTLILHYGVIKRVESYLYRG